eukprot:scaffold72900_cov31-Tisochrysis_lutea.AAC.2
MHIRCRRRPLGPFATLAYKLLQRPPRPTVMWRVDVSVCKVDVGPILIIQVVQQESEGAHSFVPSFVAARLLDARVKHCFAPLLCNCMDCGAAQGTAHARGVAERLIGR